MKKGNKGKDLSDIEKEDVFSIEEAVKGLPKDCVESVVKWKLYYDKKTGKPCGQGFFVCVAGLDEALPPYANKPIHVEERTALMIILK